MRRRPSPTVADAFARLADGAVDDDAVYATLAPVYRALYAARGRIDGQAALVSDCAPEHATRLLELGCGTGDLLARLAPDFAALGVDPSPQMCRLARARVAETGAAADVVLGTARSVAPRSVDTVAALGAVVGHVRPDEAARATLARVHETLRPGGRFVCSVHDRRALTRPRARELTTEAAGFAITQRDRQDARDGGEFVWRVRYELRRLSDGETVTTEQRVRLRAYDPDELAALLADVGFVVETVRPRQFVEGDGEDGRALVALATRPRR
jgi:SAM-dependent methyltransferase